MIHARFKDNVMHITCTTAEDSAEFANWFESADPVIAYKEFYGTYMPEPAEYNTDEGGLYLSQTGYLTRTMGSTIWNKTALHKGTKNG